MTAHRLRGLDGLRGVAVVAVVLFHGRFAPGGFMGVDVFFVLSGFLITRILRREHARTGTIRLPRFTARRLMRLYPALVVVCLFVLSLSLVSGRATQEVLHDVFFSLTYTSNLVPMASGLLDHTWTLSLEEQFYLVWPLLLLLPLATRSPWAWLPAAALIVAVEVGDLLQGQSGALHTYVRAMGLPVGCALAFAGPALLRRIAWLAPVAAPMLIAAFFLPLPGWLVTGWPISLGALLTVPLVAALVTWRIAPVEWGVPRWLGLRSYSLYLWHLPILSIALHHVGEGLPEPVRILGAIAVSLGAAELSYRFVEQPFLRLRDRTRPQPVDDPGPEVNARGSRRSDG